jgi:hypothetical protein
MESYRGLTELCGRCAREIPDGKEEACLFCEGALCLDCWERWGCCQHPGADKWQLRLRDASPAERARMMAELPPIGQPKVRRDH